MAEEVKAEEVAAAGAVEEPVEEPDKEREKGDKPGEGMGAQITKARYWQAVMYPESMIPDWQAKISDLLQLPFAYCVHDKDVDSEGAPRKEHVHIIVAFPNTTTYKHAMTIFGQLGTINTCKACVNIRHCYDYLIHDTATCRKQGKHLYEESERVTGNSFDIGNYEQITADDKRRMFFELVGYIISEGFTNLVDFTVAAMAEYVAKDSRYLEVLDTYNGKLERYCAANYLKVKKYREDVEFADKHPQPVGSESVEEG